MAPLLVVAVAEDRHGLAERRPDIVEVDAGGHHADDHLEGAWLGDLDLLDLEGVLGLTLALWADHPGGHLLGQLARFDIELRYVGDLYGHVTPVCAGGRLDRIQPTPVRFSSGTATTFKSPWKRPRDNCRLSREIPAQSAWSRTGS